MLIENKVSKQFINLTVQLKCSIFAFMNDKTDTREQLLEVACQTFAKFGYKKTTLDDIAALSGKGKTAIYYYFNSRDDIYKAVLEKEIMLALQSIRQAIASSNANEDKVRAYIESRMTIGSQTPVMNEALHEVKLKNSELVDEVVTRYANEKVKILTQILQDGINNHVFKIEEPDIAALAIETALMGLDSDNQRNGFNPQRSEKLIKLLFYGLLH